MKSTHARRNWIVACLIALGIPVLALWWWLGPSSALAPNEEVRRRVKWWTAYTPFHLIAVHSSADHVLRVDGHNYRPVEGFPPFYIHLPELDALFFVEDGDAHSQWAHFYFLREHKGMVIRSEGGLGSRICSSDDEAARVVLTSRERVVILASSYYYDFDLRKKEMASSQERPPGVARD